MTSMSKRCASKLAAPQTRKRRRNGVSLSPAVLDPTPIPPDLVQGMCIWHTNVGGALATRESVVPLQPERNQIQLDHLMLDEVNDKPTETTIQVEQKKKRRGRVKQNDSVSPSNLHFRHCMTRSTDENDGLD